MTKTCFPFFKLLYFSLCFHSNHTENTKYQVDLLIFIIFSKLISECIFNWLFSHKARNLIDKWRLWVGRRKIWFITVYHWRTLHPREKDFLLNLITIEENDSNDGNWNFPLEEWTMETARLQKQFQQKIQRKWISYN